MWQSRFWRFLLLATSPARSSTATCLEIAGRVRSNGSASSPTVASPSASRSRMARLVGSAKAANVMLSGSADIVSVVVN